MQKEFLTKSVAQTQNLAKEFASKLRGGEILCLSGDLGAGKTTFTQGLLKALGVKGPYTSPTFAIMKHYHIARSMKHAAKNSDDLLHAPCPMPQEIYHIDAYRIESEDLFELGFGDFAGKENSITIIEWPENVKQIIPTAAVWIHFEWLSNKERKIIFKS